MARQPRPATSPSMRSPSGASLVKWSCCVFIILTGCASSSLDDSRPQEETKSYNNKSANNNLTGSSQPAPRLPSTPENCSDRSHLGSLDCKDDLQCHELSKECLKCDFNCTCVYGQEVNVTCRPKRTCKVRHMQPLESTITLAIGRQVYAACGLLRSLDDGFDSSSLGKQEVTVPMICRYCYQTSHWEHTCLGNNQCRAVHSPREMFTSNCTVNSDVMCLGNRVFRKKLYCNWTSGYKWSTALLLSITLGGFGADRFYLGHWQEGIGKLFSFGGLGVWTIIDVILIAIRYLGPADHSLYI
ncbi:TM2 domain-containing protein almondex [Chionoecetes opilio]|uniref:TM2 domain-containing protein almondex n=1 Tax=Chionoecetes opilio TaxID=41210 RepID=A0A8J4Y1U7_CHIOP|nr:TM2 domain-containing protein almondex [Chionoecetes opilio]